ncbi:FMN-dependent NADH-azoreductase [Zoogloea sp.]|uniref:FMN-dependent NADH-azoreductase n=1 Tax=Zoogloea sp. TaxID=49181 RepID=UPI00260B8F6E|nr:FMN-dependent NADH-azoreductase [Zoogloea sp.]MDD3353536.1 FMN-dependent NADH-azoreductase [Zoogloea sp.]
MTTLLKINASLFANNGQSSQLADRYVAARVAVNPDIQVVTRDLAAEPVPHLDAARFTAFLTPAEERSAEQAAVVAFSDALIEELRQADEIIIGVPMYNFGIPSTLKAWIDHVARAGVTFRYTATGPEGLLKGKKAVILAARGGLYAGTPADTQTGYLQSVLGFIGITDVEFVYAEGLNMGEESKTKALDAAHQRVAELTA